MAGASTAATATGQGRGSAGVLALLTSLFFLWGFATVLNNTLLPHLRSVFNLSYGQAELIESVWFIAYLFASVPSAKLIERIGYRMALVTGLGIMAAGALLMVPAAAVPSYGLVLLALFVIASGITLLQVAANPYVAVVGAPEGASARLNLAQAFNSLGTTLAPIFGGWLILSRSASGNAVAGAPALTAAQRLADARSVELPYLVIALVLAAVAGLILFVRMPDIAPASRRNAGSAGQTRELMRHRNLVFGIPAIFLYVLAEIGCTSFFINFASGPKIGNLTHAQASNIYLPMLWGGMMVGRFIGSALMRRVAPTRVLAVASVGAFLAILTAVFTSGPLAMWALISTGLFHSIMFPTIFSLAIKGLGPLTEDGSGLLVMAIAGGALAVAQGWLADRIGLQLSFLMPAGCELYFLFYALWGSRPTHAAAAEMLTAEPRAG